MRGDGTEAVLGISDFAEEMYIFWLLDTTDLVKEKRTQQIAGKGDYFGTLLVSLWPVM